MHKQMIYITELCILNLPKTKITEQDSKDVIKK